MGNHLLGFYHGLWYHISDGPNSHPKASSRVEVYPYTYILPKDHHPTRCGTLIISEQVDSFAPKLLEKMTEKGFTDICSVEAREDIMYAVTWQRRLWRWWRWRRVSNYFVFLDYELCINNRKDFTTQKRKHGRSNCHKEKVKIHYYAREKIYRS